MLKDKPALPGSNGYYFLLCDMTKEIIKIGICLGLFLAGTFRAAPLYSQKVGYARRGEGINRIVDEWVRGEVVFQDGKVFRGEFSYNPMVPEGLLKIANHDKITTGTVFDIDSFYFYDHETSTEHIYYSIPVENNRRIFAELLFENAHYALLGRKSASFSKKYQQVPMVSTSGLYMGGVKGGYMHTKVKVQYSWLLVDIATEKIHALSHQALLRIMADRKKEIKAFVRANKLKFHHTEDYIAILKEYERLTQPD